MAYFSNGSEGDNYQHNYCERCKQWRVRDDTIGIESCPIWDVHILGTYDQCKDKGVAELLSMLIPMTKEHFADKCTMFESDGTYQGQTNFLEDDHPLICTAHEVRAIMDGRQTQLRRVDPHKFRSWQLGDLIWPRETFMSDWAHNRVIYRADVGDDGMAPYMMRGEGGWGGGVGEANTKGWKWKPSIHMPKKFARNWLRITGLREEHVQAISEADAKAEGCETEIVRCPDLMGSGNWREFPLYKAGFKTLWDSINKKRGHGWDKNPPVKVIEFERIEHG